MQLTITRPSYPTITNCQSCNGRTQIDVLVEVQAEDTLFVGQLAFCYNCLNTALVDAVGHGITTKYQSEIHGAIKNPEQLREREKATEG